ncbi:MAG: 4Fe-4S binding protein [Haliscomenobacter sp.]|nr:4Fe-4S binding protein [Haliscomenobacter sp.]
MIKSIAKEYEALARAIRSVESVAGEGWSGSFEEAAGEPVNFFGRKRLIRNNGGLGYAAGLALSGIRASVWMTGEAFLKERTIWQTAIRFKLPFLVYLVDARYSDLIPLLDEGGVAAFAARQPQEAADLALIARRVSEAALCPALVILQPASDSGSSFQPLSKERAAEYLGDPDGLIDAPTPAQALVFGIRRRRVPRWMNTDLPALIGAVKDNRFLDQEQLASQRFFGGHLPELIADAAAVFQKTAERSYSGVEVSASGKPDLWAIGAWDAETSLKEAANRQTKGEHLGVVALRQWAPFPGKEVAQALRQAKSLLVLEPGGSDWLHRQIQKTVETHAKPGGGTAVFTAKTAGSPDQQDLLLAVQHLRKGGTVKQSLVLGTAFSRAKSVSPQHEVLLQAIERAYPGISQEGLAHSDSPKTEGQQRMASKPSWAVRRFRDQGPPYARLTRFFNDTAYFFQTGETREVAADPFQALPLMPAGSASLADWGSAREQIPVFLQNACTACGACVSVCPHSAISSAAMNMESLIKGAADVSSKRGQPLSSLTPMIKNLAKICAQSVADAPDEPADLPVIVEAAFGRVNAQMKLEGEKLEQAQRDIERLEAILSDFPAVFSDELFHQAEAAEKGSGLVFGIAIDPQACNGCGACTAVCPDEALVMRPANQTLRDEESRRFALWEQLPDTPRETVQRLMEIPGQNPIQALYLQREVYASLAGGQPAGQGTEFKSMVHLVCAVAEESRQPAYQQQLKSIREAVDQLTAKVHQSLSDALPKKEFSQLEHALENLHGDKLPLDALLGKLGEGEHLSRVDTQTLQRQMQMIRDLRDLEWLLKEGPSGPGRAKYTLAVGLNEASWPGRYPYNHFAAPVALWQHGLPADAALGLIAGQMRHWLDNVRLIRRGKLEAQGKYQPSLHNPELAALAWENLETEEKEAFPPLILFVGPEAMQSGLAVRLPELFAKDWPVKVVFLDPGTANPDTGFASLQATLAMRKTFILQSSMADPKHLYPGLLEGLQGPVPAFLRLLAPFGTDGVEEDQARTALHTRAFPFLTFRPEKASTYLAAGLSLDGNPQAEADWVGSSIPLPGVQPAEPLTYFLSYADWLRALPDWEGEFTLWTESSGYAVPVRFYLESEPAALKGKVPVVVTETLAPLGFTSWIPSSRVLELTRTVGLQWKTWKEMAGIQALFQSAHSESLEQALLAKHSAELASMREAHETGLKEEQEKWMGEVKVKLRDKLIALSKMKNQA